MVLQKVSIKTDINIPDRTVQIMCSDSRQLTYCLDSFILEFFMYYAEVEALYALQDKTITLLLSSNEVVGIGSKDGSSYILFKDITEDQLKEMPKVPEYKIKESTITEVQPSLGTTEDSLGIILKFRISRHVYSSFIMITNEFLNNLMKVTNSKWVYELESKTIQAIVGENNNLLGFMSASKETFLI